MSNVFFLCLVLKRVECGNTNSSDEPLKYSIIPLIVAAALLGFFLRGNFQNISCFFNKFPHINQTIACKGMDGTQLFLGEYEEFEGQLSDWIDGRIAAGEVSEVALYFRDLENGPWFGIREKDPFTPASLFKVPVMVAVLKASEDQPGLLEQLTSLSGSYTGLMNVEHESESVQPGREYTVKQLLEKMIVYSDNASSDMLRSILSDMDPRGDVLETIYYDLGVLSTKNEGKLSAKSYASIFRILYNSRYLSLQNSEYALSLLSRSAFRNGIPAGVPRDIEVAHKFGIRDVTGEVEKQFHDCGIVYHPVRPYLLCVLTKSNNVQLAARFIRDLSKKIYEKIDSDIQEARIDH